MNEIDEIKEMIAFTKRVAAFSDDNEYTRSRILFSLHSIILESDEVLSLENFMNYHNATMMDFYPLDSMIHIQGSIKKPSWMNIKQFELILNSVYYDFAIHFERISNQGPPPSWSYEYGYGPSNFSNLVDSIFDMLYLWFEVPKADKCSLSDHIVRELNQVIENEKDDSLAKSS